jgi:hypothetical protein
MTFALSTRIAPIAIIGMLFFTSIARAATDVLSIAHDLGQKLKSTGYIYPPDGPSDKTSDGKYIDCTQFVLQVATKIIPDLSNDAKARITMSDLRAKDAESDEDKIITNADPRTKGIQQALVDFKKGTIVEIPDVKPGDFIQYWIKGTNKLWSGHAAIVERVEKNDDAIRVWLYGSHHSIGGIGTAPSEGLRLFNNDTRKIYLIRFADSSTN